ncbi:MAG TPA: Wzz/FepE/Etk N-terminal domain-containing protein, partial [Pseudomonadales bacterium]|nr:Wzz/FepE/Etk N-terminal domain-containing protein [Pseudomonadales bacterium]
MIGISDYLRILRRRRVLLWSVFGVVFVIAVLVTLALPSVYTSSGTILIEQQEIPAEMVKST